MLFLIHVEFIWLIIIIIIKNLFLKLKKYIKSNTPQILKTRKTNFWLTRARRVGVAKFTGVRWIEDKKVKDCKNSSDVSCRFKTFLLSNRGLNYGGRVQKPKATHCCKNESRCDGGVKMVAHALCQDNGTRQPFWTITSCRYVRDYQKFAKN